MAVKVNITKSNYHANPRRKRPGVHSKCKNSHNKSSKFYKKTYRGQGKK